MNYNNWLTKRDRHSPHKEAVIDSTTGNRYTYRDLNELATQLAGYLQHREGLEAGNRVAVVSPNSISYLVLFFACAKIGAVLVPLNYRLPKAGLKEQVSDCDPHLLVSAEEFSEVVTDIAECNSCSYQMLDEGERAVAAVMQTEQPEVLPYESSANDIAMILYTSGTTGKAKGAMISWQQIHWNSLNTEISLGLTGDDSSFVNTPFYHTGGWHVLLTPLIHHGGKLILQPKFDAAECNRLVDQEEISILFGIPTMLRMMMEEDNFEETDFSSVRFAICGGESCPIPIIKGYQEKGVPIRQGYGLTEAGPNCYSLPAEDAIRKKGSVGFPNFHIGVKIVDEQNKELPQGEVGELLMKGPHVFKGYWNNPDATEQAFDDGWVHTGDLFRCDDEGYYYMVGRKKEMYISGGENVYPVQVEKVIYQHEAVAQVAVIGVPDDQWGETGCAYIVLHKEASLSKEELLEYCRDYLAGYQLPKHVILREELPVGDSNKIQKKDLEEEFNNRHHG
ncbi:class I adenylate-forming enzyme family protein [Fodinibius halophilus]|uniref:Long-chain fatty acid--CoA ligase n=1 Tax=Fodinibius halophilus TaxID=1736908 RepID=A0A6M1T236_9BACT|nr:long-chain fatty acid--CoA ligase [Fodinibius halophilus]NGP89536.1 long-chain fatty acid--CoA ligase [Fodinibius halophilus]